MCAGTAYSASGGVRVRAEEVFVGSSRSHTETLGLNVRGTKTRAQLGAGKGVGLRRSGIHPRESGGKRRWCS